MSSRSLALALFLVTGCASTPAPLDVRVAPVAIAPAPVIHPPAPAPLALVPIAYDVVVPGEDVTQPLYCLDSRGYAAQVHDAAETLRWIRDAAALIRHYRQESTP